MMNVLQLQERLKDYSQQQLAQEMQMPSGSVPQYLVLGEMQRRKRMETEQAAAQAQQNQTTVAEDVVAAAGVPQAGIAGMAQAMAPKTDMGMNSGQAPMPPMPQGPAPVQQMAGGGMVQRMQAGGPLESFTSKRTRQTVYFDPGTYSVYKDPAGMFPVVDAYERADLLEEMAESKLGGRGAPEPEAMADIGSLAAAPSAYNTRKMMDPSAEASVSRTPSPTIGSPDMGVDSLDGIIDLRDVLPQPDAETDVQGDMYMGMSSVGYRPGQRALRPVVPPERPMVDRGDVRTSEGAPLSTSVSGKLEAYMPTDTLPEIGFDYAEGPPPPELLEMFGGIFSAETPASDTTPASAKDYATVGRSTMINGVPYTMHQNGAVFNAQSGEPAPATIAQQVRSKLSPTDVPFRELDEGFQPETPRFVRDRQAAGTFLEPSAYDLMGMDEDVFGFGPRPAKNVPEFFLPAMMEASDKKRTDEIIALQEQLAATNDPLLQAELQLRIDDLNAGQAMSDAITSAPGAVFDAVSSGVQSVKNAVVVPAAEAGARFFGASPEQVANITRQAETDTAGGGALKAAFTAPSPTAPFTGAPGLDEDLFLPSQADVDAAAAAEVGVDAGADTDIATPPSGTTTLAQPSGAGGGGGGASSALGGSSKAVMSDMERAFNQDKWLALAKVGFAMMASRQPNIGAAFGEAAAAGIDDLKQARKDYEEAKLAQQALALKRAGRGASKSLSPSNLISLRKSIKDQMNNLGGLGGTPTADELEQMAAIKAQLNSIDSVLGLGGAGLGTGNGAVNLSSSQPKT